MRNRSEWLVRRIQSTPPLHTYHKPTHLRREDSVRVFLIYFKLRVSHSQVKWVLYIWPAKTKNHLKGNNEPHLVVLVSYLVYRGLVEFGALNG